MLRLYLPRYFKVGLSVCSQTPDYSQPQAWQERDFEPREDDLEDWLHCFKNDTEANFGILARIVIAYRKSCAESKKLLEASFQLERKTRQRAYRRMEKHKKRVIARLIKSLKTQLRRERATRVEQIRKLKERHRQVLRRLNRSHALR
jgi:hypothetical protein